MTNYLVTGATGYIGKRLVDYLVKNNNDSIVALSKSKKNIQSSTNLKIVNCDKKYFSTVKCHQLNLLYPL